MSDAPTVSPVPDSVQLTIRCAFQTLEDQTIEASTAWSVKVLKEKIRDVHPSHPDVSTMKLIYGGHYLQDGRLLKSIFEQVPPVINGRTVFHLVGPLPRTEPRIRQRTAASTRPSGQDTSQLPNYQQFNQNWGNYSSVPSMPGQDYVEYYRNYINYCRIQQQLLTAQMQGAVPNPFPHAVYVNNGMGVPMMPYFVNPGQVQPINLTGGNNGPIVINGVIQPANVQQAPAAPAPDRVNDLIGDGLDMFYKGIRLLFVLSAVLLYSTFERFLLVIGIVLVIMFTQYRRRENRRAAANQPVNNNNAGEQQQQQAENRPVDENGDEAAQEGNVHVELTVPPPAPNNLQTVLSAVYSFVTSFVASLVPDHIPVDVN